MFNLKGLDELKEPATLAWEKRILYYPRAGLLVTLGPKLDQIVLRKVRLSEQLEKSGGDFLVVLSQPPIARVGKAFSYKLDVHSKNSGLTVKLESRPAGLRIAPDGQITWRVPDSFKKSEVDVVVTIRDASGTEMFHTITLIVKR